MKHIALLGLALSALTLAGCNSVHMPTKDGKPLFGKKQSDTHAHHKKEKHPEHKTAAKTHHFQCDKKTSVQAKYNPKNDTALVLVNAPTLNLNKQEIQMALAPSASGSRYVNDKNPASIYEWHTKGDMGILTITAGNKEYNFHCHN